MEALRSWAKILMVDNECNKFKTILSEVGVNIRILHGNYHTISICKKKKMNDIIILHFILF